MANADPLVELRFGQVCNPKISPQTQQVWLSLIALVTTFSPTILQQLGHPQLLILFLTGPILLLANRLIREPVEDFSVSDWLVLGSWLVANGFFNIYVFVYACFGSFICVLIHLFRRISSRSLLIFKGPHIWKNFSVFSVLTLLNFAIYIPYLETLKIYGRRPNMRFYLICKNQQAGYSAVTSCSSKDQYNLKRSNKVGSTELSKSYSRVGPS